MADLYGWEVSHYEVERLDGESGQWQSIAAVVTPPYDDTDEDRGSSPRYRVRAVNVVGQYGPWAETGVSSASSRPRLTLALDPATINEPGDQATVTARLNKASGQDVPITVSAELASGNDTPEQPSFTLSDNKQLMIPAGMLESTGTVTITANADDDGLNEQVRVSAVAAYVQSNIPPVTLTILDAQAPAIELNPTAITVDENSTTTYEVTLSAQPSANVLVRLTKNNHNVTVDTDTEVSGDQDILTFTMDNWGTPQEVTVRGADDADAADEMTTITHRTVTSLSAREYQSVAPATLEVTVTDNDTGSIGVTVDPPSLNVTEGAGSKTYTVSLGTRPSSHVTITAASDNPDVRVSPPSIQLNANNWRQGRRFTVSAAHDDDNKPDTATITHTIETTATEYLGRTVENVDVDVIDDDSPGLRALPATLNIAEGRDGRYNVRLNTEPSADVTVTVSSDNPDLTVDANPAVDDRQNTLTFTPDNWSQPRWVQVYAGNDPDAADDTAMLRHSMSNADSDYQGSTNVTVTVTVSDPDRPGVTIGPLSTSLVYEAGRETESDGTIAEAHPSFYTIRLDTQPTRNVVIKLDDSDNSDVKVDTDPTMEGYQDTLTFTPTNWTGMVVEVHAANDGDKDDEKATITHTVVADQSADEYDTVSIASLDVTVADNDAAGVTLILSKPLGLSKDGTATYEVVLDTQPDGVVIIGVESSTDKVTADPRYLYFSGILLDHGRNPEHGDWDKPQTITVTAEDAAAGTVTLKHKVIDVNAGDEGWSKVRIGAEVGRVNVTIR